MSRRRILAWAACLGMLPLACAHPEADAVKPDEDLVVFPSVCWQDPDSGRWQVDVHAWIFEPPLVELGAAWRWLSGEAGDDLIEGEAENSLARERLRWFLVDNERNKRLRLAVAGVDHVTSASGPNGHVREQVAMPADWRPPEGEDATVRGEAPDGREFTGQLACLPPGGLSVISDIDDTVKISEVHDKRALLANTFLRPYRPVEGMAAFYSRLEREHEARFHYLSASPWQLYPALSEFLDAEGFPAGTFHLKHFRLKDESFFSLFADPFDYKIGLIEDLIARMPGRDLILIGDSGEQDPEVYGEIARRYPDRVRAILIRDVDAPGAEPRDRRRAVAFAGVDAARVHWFSGGLPGEIGDLSFEPLSRTVAGQE